MAAHSNWACKSWPMPVSSGRSHLMHEEDLPWLGRCKCRTENEAADQDRPEAVSSFIATAYFNQATSLLNRGLFAESEAYFREVLRLRPDHVNALNNLGTAVWRQGRLQEAEKCYRRALALEAQRFCDSE